MIYFTALYLNVTTKALQRRGDAENTLNQIMVGFTILTKNLSPCNHDEEQCLVNSAAKIKVCSTLIPSFAVTSTLGESFFKWLRGCGGGKSERDARQTVSRAFKFLKFCCEDDDEPTIEIIDFCICSPVFLFKFVDALQEIYSIGHSGRVGYIDSISELIDFRKVSGAPDSLLRNVTAAEIHLKKARKSVSKMMKLQRVRDLDIDTLDSKGHWATMDELLQVIPSVFT